MRSWYFRLSSGEQIDGVLCFVCPREFGNDIVLVEVLIRHDIPRYSSLEQSENGGGIIYHILHVLNQYTARIRCGYTAIAKIISR